MLFRSLRAGAKGQSALLHQGTLAFGAGTQGKGLLVRLELPLQMPAVLSETIAAQATGKRS